MVFIRWGLWVAWRVRVLYASANTDQGAVEDNGVEETREGFFDVKPTRMHM